MNTLLAILAFASTAIAAPLPPGPGTSQPKAVPGSRSATPVGKGSMTMTIPAGEGLVLSSDVTLYGNTQLVVVTKTDDALEYHVRIYDRIGFGWYDQTVYVDEDSKVVQVLVDKSGPQGVIFRIVTRTATLPEGDVAIVTADYSIPSWVSITPVRITTIIDPDN